jgi:hypothetical protein
MTASDGVETHTSSFAFIFFCFFDFRLSTFTHRASAGSLSGGISSESETRVEVFSFFEGTDEDEEGRFMVVAFWEMKCSPYQLARAPHLSSIRPWEADILTHTRTIQSSTSPLVQSGSRTSPEIAQETSLVATLQMSTSHLSSSPIDWTILNTFNSRDGAPQESPSQPFKKLSSKTFNLPRRASLSGHLVSEH